MATPPKPWKLFVLGVSTVMLVLVIYTSNKNREEGEQIPKTSASSQVHQEPKKNLLSKNGGSKINRQQPALQPDRVQTEGQTELNALRRSSFASSLEGVDVDKLSTTELELTLHSYLDNENFICRRRIRMGNIDDGGWEICDDKEVRPTPPCLIYSMGIAGDWSFDDDVSRLYGCHVFAIDPTVKQEAHNRTPLIHFFPWGISNVTGKNKDGWQMYTLGDMKKELGHGNKSIDVIKMDVEHFEWRVLPEMISSGQLKGAKQLHIEFHVTGQANSRDGVKLLQILERDGWARYYARKNIHCARKLKGFPTIRTSCYEVFFLRKSLYAHT